MAARNSDLINSARRSLWLKTQSGGASSKLRLFGLSLSGDHLYSPALQEALEHAVYRKKSFEKKNRTGRKKI